ncbi:MAG: nuclear transport factor 2 family protein [Atopobiaceae bacterium]|nr:nuclear transport factor 2 family protein [Atopobiaceae bacterium]
MTSTDAQVVHAVYRSMYRFMIARDVERLGALLDDSFVLVHMTGRRQSKDEFLKSVSTGALRYFSEVEESCLAHVDGDKATCRGRSLVEASPFGAGRSTWRLQQDMDFVRRDGKWLITRSIAGMY